MIRLLTTEIDLRKYDDWAHAHPQGNLWQSLERKKYVEACGKHTRIYLAEEEGKIIASALVVIDRTTGGYSTWEIPRGPLYQCESGKYESTKVEKSDSLNMLTQRILDDAKQDRCIALYLSPTLSLSTHSGLRASGPRTASALPHFRTSPRRIHAEATRIIDLTQSEEQILAGMHQKGRYNIGVARKYGIVVETRESRVSSASDIDAFYSLLQGTGSRDGFVISQKSHYARFLSTLEGSFLMLAKHEGKPIAGLIGVIWPPPPLTPPPRGEGNLHRTGIYYYGASSYEHRHLMAPYLLQWEAMQCCKKAGCTRYDLLGIENPKNEKPNSKNIGFWNFEFGISAHQSSWIGITEFKRKFGGKVVTYPQEQMIVLRPMTKKILEWKRRIVG